MSPTTVSIRLTLVWCLAVLGACTDAYLPDEIKAPASFLVVDGFINAAGVTSIKLSRTVSLSSAAAPPAETRATAYVEEQGGARFALREGGVKGTYASDNLALNPARSYRLHLTTFTGQEYASDYVPAKTTPPIDAISWKFEDTNFNLYVNAHDATSATQYYRWEFEETWETRPPATTNLQYVNHAMTLRTVPLPRACWPTEASKTIQIDKTTGLSQDLVAEHRLRQLPANTERLYFRYSILVRQHALTKEEFGYWELLRKNTENIGTLFDPQPAQLTGNVHCLSSPGTVALGFVSAHTVTEKRLFITPADLPQTASILSGYEKCIPPMYIDLYPCCPITVTPEELMESYFGRLGYLPAGQEKDRSGKVIAYYAVEPYCLDCRLRGTDVKPSFWP